MLKTEYWSLYTTKYQGRGATNYLPCNLHLECPYPPDDTTICSTLFGNTVLFIVKNRSYFCNQVTGDDTAMELYLVSQALELLYLASSATKLYHSSIFSKTKSYHH